MKKLLPLLLAISPFVSFAQSETNNPVTYDTTITETANGEGPFTWNVRITRQKSDKTPRPAIMAIHGSGEVGTDTTKLTLYGPHYWLLNGWDGSVGLGNGTHYPVIVTIQQPVQNMRPWHLKAVLDALLAALPIKRNSVHVTGLSQGSYEWGELIGFAASAGDQTAMSEIKSWVDLEGVGPGDNFLGFDPVFPTAYATWASKYGGKFLGLEGVADSRNEWLISQAMNAASPNSAYFCYENYSCTGVAPGGHGCWNTMYNPKVNNWTPAGNGNLVPSTNPATTMGSYSFNPNTGTNIFQWMLRQGDTSLASAVVIVPPPLVVPTIYKSAADSGLFARGNCTCGSPTSVTYSVPAGKYSSTISQAAADAQATADLAANGPAYANLNGACTPVLVTTITTVTKVWSDGTTQSTTTSQ